MKNVWEERVEPSLVTLAGLLILYVGIPRCPYYVGGFSQPSLVWGSLIIAFPFLLLVQTRRELEGGKTLMVALAYAMVIVVLIVEVMCVETQCLFGWSLWSLSPSWHLPRDATIGLVIISSAYGLLVWFIARLLQMRAYVAAFILLLWTATGMVDVFCDCHDFRGIICWRD